MRTNGLTWLIGIALVGLAVGCGTGTTETVGSSGSDSDSVCYINVKQRDRLADGWVV